MLMKLLLPAMVMCVHATAHAQAVNALKARMAEAARYSSEKGGMALLVKHNGKIIWETYANGGGKNIPQRIYSGTKAYWGLAALVAAESELLDLDEKVAETLTEWQKDRARSQIRVRDLLDFTGGLPAMPELHQNDYKDRTTAALKARCVTSAGKSFIYGPAALQVFHEVLARKLKKRTPVRFLEREVLSPLGLGPQRYLPDSQGAPLLAAGFMQTARQWSGIGKVLLEKGEPVLDEDDGFFDHLLRGGKPNPAYAFGIWNNHAAESRSAREVDVETMLDRPWSSQFWRNACLCRDAPAELLASIGSYGQRLYAVPSLKLVVVRLGSGGAFRDAAFLRLLFKK